MHSFSWRLLAALLCFVCAGCGSASTADERKALSAERRADEQQKRNPVKKGRYRCWQTTAAGDRLAPELFVLSDDMYQIDDVTGKYAYNHSSKTIAWISGPLYSNSAKRIGLFQPKGALSPGGVPREASIVQVFEAESDESKAMRKLLHCDCLETE